MNRANEMYGEQMHLRIIANDFLGKGHVESDVPQPFDAVVICIS